MDHITEIDKEPYFDHCLELVKEIMKEQNYSLLEEEYKDLTIEIMDTSVFSGGDYDDENIILYANEYIKNNFLSRFKMIRDKDVNPSDY